MAQTAADLQFASLHDLCQANDPTTMEALLRGATEPSAGPEIHADFLCASPRRRESAESSYTGSLKEFEAKHGLSFFSIWGDVSTPAMETAQVIQRVKAEIKQQLHANKLASGPLTSSVVLALLWALLLVALICWQCKMRSGLACPWS